MIQSQSVHLALVRDGGKKSEVMSEISGMFSFDYLIKALC